MSDLEVQQAETETQSNRSDLEAAAAALRSEGGEPSSSQETVPGAESLELESNPDSASTLELAESNVAEESLGYTGENFDGVAEQISAAVSDDSEDMEPVLAGAQLNGIADTTVAQSEAVDLALEAAAEAVGEVEQLIEKEILIEEESLPVPLEDNIQAEAEILPRAQENSEVESPSAAVSIGIEELTSEELTSEAQLGPESMQDMSSSSQKEREEEPSASTSTGLQVDREVEVSSVDEAEKNELEEPKPRRRRRSKRGSGASRLRADAQDVVSTSSRPERESRRESSSAQKERAETSQAETSSPDGSEMQVSLYLYRVSFREENF